MFMCICFDSCDEFCLILCVGTCVCTHAYMCAYAAMWVRSNQNPAVSLPDYDWVLMLRLQHDLNMKSHLPHDACLSRLIQLILCPAESTPRTHQIDFIL